MSSQLLISVPGTLVMGSFVVLRFVVIFETAVLTTWQPIQMVQMILLNDGVEHTLSLTPNTPEFESFMAWVTEVEMSDEQEQALYPLISVLGDYYGSSDNEH